MGHRGPHGTRFRQIAENGPKIQKWPFLTIFQKFQKHGFSTIICHQNAKFGGPRVKNDHSRAKNVIFRILGNIDYLRSRFLHNHTFLKILRNFCRKKYLNRVKISQNSFYPSYRWYYGILGTFFGTRVKKSMLQKKWVLFWSTLEHFRLFFLNLPRKRAKNGWNPEQTYFILVKQHRRALMLSKKHK